MSLRECRARPAWCVGHSGPDEAAEGHTGPVAVLGSIEDGKRSKRIKAEQRAEASNSEDHAVIAGGGSERASGRDTTAGASQGRSSGIRRGSRGPDATGDETVREER